jgi:HK97 family phage prohead protease
MSYTDYPKSASNNAKRALKYKEESGNPRGCGTPVGWRRATQLANREPISEDVVKRMASFNRHRQHKDVPYDEGCGGLMWDAWGGTSGVDWAIRKSKQIDEEKMFEAVSETKGVMDTLKEKAKEHNEDVGDVASKRTTASTLKKVYDRGIGAYRTNPQSVRPSVTSASQWAFARVNSFLYVLRNGKFRSGKHDTDLLPSGHPMSSKNHHYDIEEKAPQLSYFRTQEEAEEYAEFLGCTGTHTHTMDGETFFMACSSHERNIELEENRQGKNNMNEFITKRAGIIKDVDVDRRMIEGYYSVFDYKDSDGDIMMKGCYTKTIKENGPNGKNRIMHLYQHDPLTVLGKPSMLVEDEKGLYFRTAISDTQLGTDVLKLYRDGVLTEHSVGINFVQRDFSNEDEAYIVREVKMWEGSTVTWGANEMAKGGMAKGSMEDQLEHYKKLNQAFYSGDYTDETYQLIEMHIKSFEQEIKKSLQTMEAEPITSEKNEADFDSIFKQFNNQLQIEKEFKLWT